MSDNKELVSLDEARSEVEVAITRLALLHLSFSRILIDELGEDKGTELTVKAIMEYGKRIADRVSEGKPDLPKWGVHSGTPYQDEDGRFIVQGCNLAKIFKEYNELNLGRLYCYIDAARSMSSDVTTKLIHTTCEACGDERCTFESRQTTEGERKNFINRDSEWQDVDPRLVKEKGED